MRAGRNHANGSAEADPSLAIEHTRRELFGFLSDASDAGDRQQYRGNAVDQDDPSHQNNAQSSGIDWGSVVQNSAAAWWHEHPLRAGTMLIRPSIEQYARKRPLQSVAIAAAVGAGLILFRPWRLVSASALVLSLYRSTNLAGMASSLLNTASNSLQKDTKNENGYRKH
jgi:hypothetical protein